MPEDRPAETQVSDETVDIKDLEQKLAAAEDKAKENWDLFLRTRADLENYRKVTERQRDASIRRGKKDMFLRLLEIRDNFDRALKSGGDSRESLAAGIDIIARQIDGLLKAEGIEPVDSVGKAFDPAVHDAVASWESKDVTEDTVTDELEKGYMYQGELLRAARVRVAKPGTN